MSAAGPKKPPPEMTLGELCLSFNRALTEAEKEFTEGASAKRVPSAEMQRSTCRICGDLSLYGIHPGRCEKIETDRLRAEALSAAFTPGPWTPGPWRLGRDLHLYVHASNGALVARCHESQVMGSDEPLANSHLIVTAPDLYELCRRADEALSNACDPVKDSLNPLEALRYDIRAALAKAEGRAEPRNETER